MIKIGIVGLGNANGMYISPFYYQERMWVFHWICDKNLEKKSIVEEKN